MGFCCRLSGCSSMGVIGSMVVVVLVCGIGVDGVLVVCDCGIDVGGGILVFLGVVVIFVRFVVGVCFVLIVVVCSKVC